MTPDRHDSTGSTSSTTDASTRTTPATDLDGEVALVTGGTDGIGEATATGLARRGATVVIVGSTAQKGRDAASRMATETGNADIEFLQADLSLMSEVRRLADRFRTEYDRLDMLIHSAGVIHGDRTVTDEGLEASFVINYLSRFLLTNLLLDRLEASAPSSVVNIAYAGGNSADKLRFDDLQGADTFSGKRALDQAQVANDLFGLELADRLDGTGVSVSVVNPGLVDTDIRQQGAPWYIRMVDYVLWFLKRSPNEAAETPVYLAADPAGRALTGRFFGPNREEKPVPQELRDAELRERLWRVSEELTGVTGEHEPAGPDADTDRSGAAAEEQAR
jgi:NAD(P)-dependent dehydrogenase (short-subunit alcohol dehydrogenase family)